MDPKYKKHIFCKTPFSECKNKVNDKCDCLDDDRVREALKEAHEIRRFEIDLYWRRSLYFWGFQTAFFGAYALAFGNIDPSSCCAKAELWLTLLPAIAVAILGLFVSILWYYLAKGSKAWQENWEHHIDQLENAVTGRLYKTVLGDERIFYSVTRINQLFIRSIGLGWIFFLALPFGFCNPLFFVAAFIGAIFAVFILRCLFKFCAKRDSAFRIKSSFPQCKKHRVNGKIGDGSVRVYYRWKEKEKNGSPADGD